MSAKGRKTQWPPFEDKIRRLREHYGASASKALAKHKAPETREEAENLLQRVPPSKITETTWGWLDLEADLDGLERQIEHVETTLDDKLLAAMLSERLLDLKAAMRNQARKLAKLAARQAEDTYCKYYVRKRLREIAPEDSLSARELYDSISRDLDQFSHKPD